MPRPSILERREGTGEGMLVANIFLYLVCLYREYSVIRPHDPRKEQVEGAYMGDPKRRSESRCSGYVFINTYSGGLIDVKRDKPVLIATKSKGKT